RSKLVENLFVVGEVADVDGFTGGFNLQAAWSMGNAAGRGVRN
ncbi:MAG: NAD(P)/FAD-dependent oxidoreductase, partial [Selenomonadaceae bacterium]|nr:NAD(P)/FAD-dependent oxidoreductase [Selenomonadaceae bacterium]